MASVRDVLGRIRAEVEDEWRVVVAILTVAAAAWVFVELADEVVEGNTSTIDRTLLLALRTPGDVEDPLGPSWFEEMMRDFTALGGVGVLTLFTLAAVGYLLLAGDRRLAASVALMVIGGVVISSLIKAGVDRPRPDLVTHGSHVSSASFPSGHSMLSATVYLTLAALLVRVRAVASRKGYILAVAVLLTVLVGASRVYLGVHWPTDVLAGWTIGAAWAVLVWGVGAHLHRHGDKHAPDSVGGAGAGFREG